MAAADGPQEPQPQQPPATRWALLLLTLAMFCMQSTQSIATQSNAAFATGLYGPENVAAIAAFGGQLVGLGAFVEFIVNVKASTPPHLSATTHTTTASPRGVPAADVRRAVRPVRPAAVPAALRAHPDGGPADPSRPPDGDRLPHLPPHHGRGGAGVLHGAAILRR